MKDIKLSVFTETGGFASVLSDKSSPPRVKISVAGKRGTKKTNVEVNCLNKARPICLNQANIRNSLCIGTKFSLEQGFSRYK